MFYRAFKQTGRATNLISPSWKRFQPQSCQLTNYSRVSVHSIIRVKKYESMLHVFFASGDRSGASYNFQTMCLREISHLNPKVLALHCHLYPMTCSNCAKIWGHHNGKQRKACFWLFKTGLLCYCKRMPCLLFDRGASQHVVLWGALHHWHCSPWRKKFAVRSKTHQIRIAF